MADNALVTPLAFSTPRAIDKRTQDKQQKAPQAIPVSVVAIVGEFVTVKAEVTSPFTIPQITIPQAFSAYIRPPTQVGDKGFAVTADYYLGGQSGLGGGTANLYQRANLATLVFVPVSQKAFSARNPNQAFINGPQGVAIENTAGTTKITINPDGTVTITSPTTITLNGTSVTVNGSLVVNGSITGGGGVGSEMNITGAVNVTGEVTANSIPLSAHIHSGVTTGSGDTGGPLP